jgi:hypothetical protein
VTGPRSAPAGVSRYQTSRIIAGIAAPLVAFRLARGTGRRAALWHIAFGITDLNVEEKTMQLEIEVPEISAPRFVPDRRDERGAAVPLMGPADPGTATLLMLPSR